MSEDCFVTNLTYDYSYQDPVTILTLTEFVTSLRNAADAMLKSREISVTS